MLLLLLVISVGAELAGDSCPGVCPSSCSLHSVAPVSHPTSDLGLQLTCNPGEAEEGWVSVEEGLNIVPGAEEVAVLDTVTLRETDSDGECDVSSLLPALTFWCQGKPGGCSLSPATLSSLTRCPDLSLVRVHWHSEPDYSSTEIPCPAYNRGPLSKKFIPLENTCYLKTVLQGSWQEAREECWRWGGDLAFPLLSNKSTPRSWLQDSEEVWLAGSEEFHARPALPSHSEAFQPGTFMACFSDLWRCTDSDGPFSDPTSATARRGLCAIPPSRRERVSPPCPAVTDPVLGVTWPRTQPGSASSQPCPEGQQGEASWDCGDWGLRTSPAPHYSHCTALGDINHLIQDLTDPEARPVEVLEQINQDISHSGQSLGGGDIISVVQLLDNAVTVQQAREHDEDEEDKLEATTNFVTTSLKTVDNLVSQPAAWLNLGDVKTQENVNNIQNIVDSAAHYLVERVREEGGDIEITPTEHVELQLKLVTDSQLSSSLGDEAAVISLQLSEETNRTDKSLVVLKSYKNLGCIINAQKSCESPKISSKQVNSMVVGADVYHDESREKVHNISVEITFDHLYHGSQYSLSEVECVFWDKAAWNSSGCSLVRTSLDSSTCQCLHLTNFAVLMDINNIFHASNTDFSFLSTLSIVCSSVSVVFLAVSIWVFSCVPSVRSDRTCIHTNLCCSLLLAHLLLLTGLDATHLPSLCSAVAVCLHFLFLSSFCWMLVEGWHIYRLLTEVWQTGRCGMFPYYLLGYLLPAVIVTVSLLCNELLGLDSYGSSQFCWIDNKHGLIWAFMGPVAFIITFNIIISILAMSVARMAISRNNNLDRSQEMLTQLKGCLSLISILGLSWLSGFLYFSKALSWLGVVFTITNSLQGVAIFIFHVLLNDKVRRKLVSYLARRFQVLQEETLSRADTTKKTVKRKYLGRNNTEISFVESSGATREMETSITQLEDSVQVAGRDSDGNNNPSEISDKRHFTPPGPPPEPEPDY